jgi:hypothetical protein
MRKDQGSFEEKTNGRINNVLYGRSDEDADFLVHETVFRLATNNMFSRGSSAVATWEEGLSSPCEAKVSMS